MLLARMLANGPFQPMTAQHLLERVAHLPVGCRVYIFPNSYVREPRVFSVRTAGAANVLVVGERVIRTADEFRLPPDFAYGAAVAHYENEVFMVGSPWASPRPGPVGTKRTRPHPPSAADEGFEEVIRRDPILSADNKRRILEAILIGKPVSSKCHPAAAATAR